MKERPILFQAAMIRALLAGTKTQTRRALRVQPGPSCTIEEGINGETRFVYSQLHGDGPGHEVHERRSPCSCPYGVPGDRLWVRENGWERPFRTAKMMREGADTWEPYYFDADGIPWQDAADFKAWGFKRRPSIHMPRTASRITLEVTGVRVERLQSISEGDAVAEGLTFSAKARKSESCMGIYECHMPDGLAHFDISAVDLYRKLWEQINGAGSWEASPWCWVVEFRRVTPPC